MIDEVSNPGLQIGEAKYNHQLFTVNAPPPLADQLLGSLVKFSLII